MISTSVLFLEKSLHDRNGHQRKKDLKIGKEYEGNEHLREEGASEIDHSKKKSSPEETGWNQLTPVLLPILITLMATERISPTTLLNWTLKIVALGLLVEVLGALGHTGDLKKDNVQTPTAEDVVGGDEEIKDGRQASSLSGPENKGNLVQKLSSLDHEDAGDWENNNGNCNNQGICKPENPSSDLEAAPAHNGHAIPTKKAPVCRYIRNENPMGTPQTPRHKTPTVETDPGKSYKFEANKSRH